MSTLPFTKNDRPTLGVEVELAVVDAATGALTSGFPAIAAALPNGQDAKIKPEMVRCTLEINTGVCETIREAGHDLRASLNTAEAAAQSQNLRLLWSATHPFSSWRDQEITENKRYHHLVDLMHDVVTRMVTCGLHVHVAVDSGDKAVMICDRMLRHLPLLLALSSNSPFYDGRVTGLHSSRADIMQGLPTAGLPGRMRNYSEYVWLINHLVQTGFINTMREIWWDIRPHHDFGTVEVRICDLPANPDQALALAALVQCLVVALSREIDEGTFLPEYHPMMVQQNKWRALRYGPAAQLVSAPGYVPQTVQEAVDELVSLLLPVAKDLKCEQELAAAARLPSQAGSVRQLEIFERTGSREAVVRELLR